MDLSDSYRSAPPLTYLIPLPNRSQRTRVETARTVMPKHGNLCQLT